MEINKNFIRKPDSASHIYNSNDRSPYRSNKETRPFQAEINQVLNTDLSFMHKIDTMSKLYEQSLSQLQNTQKTSKGHNSNKTSISKGTLENLTSQRSDYSANYLSSRHLTSSPNREKVQDNLTRIQSRSYEESKDLRYICKKIFEFYASLGNRLNTENLKLTQLHKFANDALIVDKRMNTQVLDPLFYRYSQNHGSINFEQFLLFLLDIAVSYNQGLSRKEAFAQLFQMFIKPLYSKLYSQTDLGEYEIIFKEPIQRETCIILKSIAPAFALLHFHYFSSEYQKLAKNEYQLKCENYMQNFLREFEVCPALLTFGVAHSVLREVLNMSPQEILYSLEGSLDLPKNYGIEFTLLKFLVYIFRLALVLGFQQYGENIFDEHGRILQKEALLLLLQRLEMSRGSTNFREHISASNHTSFSVWPKELIADLTALNHLDTKAVESYRHEHASRRTPRKKSFGAEDQTPSFSNLDAHSSVGRGRSSAQTTQRHGTPSPLRSQHETSTHREEIKQVFDENSELLLTIFKTFCSFTGGNETSRVKNMSLIKLFKDAGLVKDISKKDLNNSPLQSNSYSFKNNDDLGTTSFTTTLRKRAINPSELDTFLREQFYLKSYKNSPNNKSVDKQVSPERSSPRPKVLRERSFFEVFLRAIEFVACRVYPDLESNEAVFLVITQNLADVLEEKKISNMKVNTKNNFKMLVSILDEASIVDVLGRLKKAIHYFYKSYCRQNNLMSTEEFLGFCRNFKILPNILPKDKLVEIFQTLAPLCPITNSNSKSDQDEESIENKNHNMIEGLVIDENLFVEAIALSAAKINIFGQHAHIMDRLIYLIEKLREGTSLSVNQKMLQANEMQKSQKELVEVINYIKTKYWKLIQGGRGKQDRVNNFDEIFE